MRTLTRFVAAVLTAAVVPACSVIASSVAHADPVATTATVLKVVDGDTVDIVDDIRGRLRIRLLGIDTPETKKPGYTVGCWGPQASEFAKSTLLGLCATELPAYQRSGGRNRSRNPGGNIGDEGHKSHNSHS
jgi:micrococcal nuclease